MYYSYPCFKCEKAVWEYEDDQEAQYDAWQKLIDAMKMHYQKDHDPSQLLYTDEELRYYFEKGLQKTPEKPVNAVY